MAYIYLKELKKILPGILDQWIDKDDESWEWIFREIEQKCHVGKRLSGKGKKSKDKEKWKTKIESMVNTHSTDLCDLRNNFNELDTKINELNNKYDEFKRNATTLSAKMKTLANSVEVVKLIAQTAKQRTEVDYSKYSGKSDGKIGYCNPEAKKLNEELNSMTSDDIARWCREQDNKEVKENEQTKTATEPVEGCTTCKHYCGEYVIKGPCLDCINYNCWEAKDE